MAAQSYDVAAVAALAEPILGELRPSRRIGCTKRRGRASWIAVELLDEHGETVGLDGFDLSAEGVYIHSELLLCPGEMVRIQLRLPSAIEPISLEGKVVRCEIGEDGQTPGMDIAFVDVAETSKRALMRFAVKGRPS